MSRAQLIRARHYIDAALAEMPGAAPAPLALGALLKARREEMGLSLQQVADAARMSKAHVWDLERGKATNPGVETIAMISRALGADPVELFRAALEQTNTEHGPKQAAFPGGRVMADFQKIDDNELAEIDAIMEAWVRELQPAGCLLPQGVERRVQALARLMQHAHVTVRPLANDTATATHEEDGARK